MTDQDIRWKQRFQNFEKALSQLRSAAHKGDLSDLEKAGLVQVYEFTFELGWKTLKNYLEEKKVVALYPRDTIRESFNHGLIRDGDTWMDMLEKRNLMSHTYDKEKADVAVSLIINSYMAVFEELFQQLKAAV